MDRFGSETGFPGFQPSKVLCYRLPFQVGPEKEEQEEINSSG